MARRRVIPPAVVAIIAAFRSGKYKQIRGALGNKKEGFCAIGLIGNLLFPTAPRSRFTDGDLSEKALRKLQNGLVWDGAGCLRDKAGNEVCPSIMSLNDGWVYGEPYTFEELADCIEWAYLYT